MPAVLALANFLCPADILGFCEKEGERERGKRCEFTCQPFDLITPVIMSSHPESNKEQD